MILYEVLNKINGKVYIGITRTTLKKRFSSHLLSVKKGSMTPFHCALRLYGEDNFEISIIAQARDWLSLQEAERIVIAQRGSIAPGGYNITPGGDGFHGTHTEKTKQKFRDNSKKMWARMTPEERAERGRRISEAKKGKPQPWARELVSKMKGVSRSPEFRTKVSEGMKRYVKTLEPGEMARRARREKYSQPT